MRSRLPLDPRVFRRAVHASGAAFIGYYLIPMTGAGALVRLALPLSLAAVAILIETLRLTGQLPRHLVLGLRRYESHRPASYAYFAVAAGILLLATPQSIAVPCIVGAALLDPVVGEARNRDHGRLGAGLAGALATALFLLVGWSLPVSLLAGAVLLAGERLGNRAIDDDFLMPMLPALALIVLAAIGAAPIPADLIRPLGGAVP